jgi:hypothetical protein
LISVLTILPVGQRRSLRTTIATAYCLASRASAQAEAELYFPNADATIRLLQSLLEVIYV